MLFSGVYNYSTDALLWDDFLAGNQVAYACMYERYAKVLYNYGYKIAQNRQLTEDCLQDLFLSILETRNRLGRTDSIKFYLMRSLRRELVRRLQAESRFDADPDAIEFRVEFHYEPTWLDAQVSADQSAALLRELDVLPPRQKEALFLKYFDNLTYEEIAGVMGIEQSSAYKVIYKAIAALQKRVDTGVLLLLLMVAKDH